VSALSRRALRHGSRPDRHAWFDFGYFVETLNQADLIFNKTKAAVGLDGYRYITKAIGMKKEPAPEMEFAAALVTHPRREVAAAHYQRAAAGAPADSLLARNLATMFPRTRD
jgi:hypothetical protein